MKMQIRIVFVILGLLLIGGCGKKKKYETSVSGYVTEKNGDRKIAGAKVYLTELQFGTYTTNGTFVDSSEADANGYYEMTADLRGEDYVIFATAKNYYPQNDRYNDVENLKDIIPGKDQACNVELWPIAHLKMRFIDTSNIYVGVDVNPVFGGQGYQIREPDATIWANCRGNMQNSVHYFPQPGGGHHERKIYTPGQDTSYVEINY